MGKLGQFWKADELEILIGTKGSIICPLHQPPITAACTLDNSDSGTQAGTGSPSPQNNRTERLILGDSRNNVQCAGTGWSRRMQALDRAGNGRKNENNFEI